LSDERLFKSEETAIIVFKSLGLNPGQLTTATAQMQKILQLIQMQQQQHKGDQDRRPSKWFPLLQQMTFEAILALISFPRLSEWFIEMIRLFLQNHRHAKLSVDGKDIMQLGKPFGVKGPKIGEIKTILFNALIDGEVGPQKEDQIAKLENIIRECCSR